MLAFYFARKEIKKSEVREDIKTNTKNNATFCNWTFNTDIMNVIKYRLLKFQQAIDKKMLNIKIAKFYCDKCNKEFEEIEVYNRDYKCPNDNTELK